LSREGAATKQARPTVAENPQIELTLACQLLSALHVRKQHSTSCGKNPMGTPSVLVEL
jgi:hypothetical protein